MRRRHRATGLAAELTALDELGAWTRGRLYSVTSGACRATATTVVAAAAAERTYRLSDRVPQWQNEVSVTWRGHLGAVWAFLAGDETKHRALSDAIADYLTSPLNHTDGQDGPDDFDRPQVIASYSAAASVVMWGVDFATTSVAQVFEILDLRYGGAFTDGRAAEVTALQADLRQVVDRVVNASDAGRLGVDLIESVRLESAS